ncbi:hypothetical protein ACSBPQ_15945 [Stenotrophomonas sp. JC08]|uniref:hypothetical protein n=1 Tax=Stenotrophomonas sp. JC08 TaxID=3445779 RepID=UPI003FA1E548
MQTAIATLCLDYYLTPNVLATLLNRSPDALRQRHLKGMVKSRRILLAFPSKPTHERQAYRTNTDGESEDCPVEQGE